jgi:hypothetical protein
MRCMTALKASHIHHDGGRNARSKVSQSCFCVFITEVNRIWPLYGERSAGLTEAAVRFPRCLSMIFILCS